MAPVVWCLLAALLFGASTPVAKALLDAFDPWLLAGLLYLGAALATAPFSSSGGSSEARFSRANLRSLTGAVVLGGVAGPVLLLFGLREVGAASASLWLNLETVATSLLAFAVFRESLDRTTWIALLVITAAGVGLAAPFDPGTSRGAILIAAACFCWGLDNNFTAVIDGWTPAQSTFAKGLVAGLVNVGIGLATGETFEGVRALDLGGALIVGGLGYGASIVLYIRGAQQLGAGRSQMIFSTAPFAGVAVAAAMGETLASGVLPAGALMVLGVALLQREKHLHAHTHDATVHTHRHRHDDGHHHHDHEDGSNPRGWHTHEHHHEEVLHEHEHRPDLHHRHAHLLLVGVLLGSLLLPASTALAVPPPGVRSRLVIEGTPRPGGEIGVRVEVSWPGRPETYQPTVPKLTVPEQGAARLGGTGSTFGSGRTTWWTDTTVTLPDWDGPWMVGPATLNLVDRRGAPEGLSVAAKRLRQKRAANLVGRGLGSAVVLAFAALFVVRLWISAGGSPVVRNRDRLAGLLDTCTRALDTGERVEFLRAVLALRNALEAAGTAPDGPDSAAIAERLDRVRFGGEEIDVEACLELLEPLTAAARTS